MLSEYRVPPGESLPHIRRDPRIVMFQSCGHIAVYRIMILQNPDRQIPLLIGLESFIESPHLVEHIPPDEGERCAPDNVPGKDRGISVLLMGIRPHAAVHLLVVCRVDESEIGQKAPNCIQRTY